MQIFSSVKLLIFASSFAFFSSTIAHAAPPCPVGKKIVIDNGDPGYVETGDDWVSWPNAGQSIGNDYRYLSHTVGGSDRQGKATWKPVTLPADGTYKIEVVFRATENRSPDADYFVHDADGKVSHKVVDQRDGATAGNAHGPVYKNLGNYHLATGKGYVLLDGTDDNYSDEADAAVFTLISCGVLPPPPPGPCAGITKAGYELCQESKTRCAGVFTGGVGCKIYCATVGMVCVAHYGGELGCSKESTSFGCNVNTGNKTDWCECEAPAPPPPDQGVPPVDASAADSGSRDAAAHDDIASVDMLLHQDGVSTRDVGGSPSLERGLVIDGNPTRDAGASGSPSNEISGGCGVASSSPSPMALFLLLGLVLSLLRRRL